MQQAKKIMAFCIALAMTFGLTAVSNAAASLNEFYDFNQYTQSGWLNDSSPGTRQEKMPEGWTLLLDNQSTWTPATPDGNDGSNIMKAVTVDMEHGASFGAFFNNASFGRKFPSSIPVDSPLYISFEFNMEELPEEVSPTVNLFLNRTTSDLLGVIEKNLFYPGVDSSKAVMLNEGEWNKLDITVSAADSEGNRTIYSYVNGVKTPAEPKFSVKDITAFCVSSRGYSDYGNIKLTRFDNFRFTDDISEDTLQMISSDVTATAAVLNAAGHVEIKFDKTLDLTTLNENLLQVSGTRKNLDTGETTEVENEITASLMGDGLYWNPVGGFLPNSVYTVTLPEGLRGTHGEPISGNRALTVTVQPAFDFFDDYERFATGSDIALNPQSSGGAAGYGDNNAAREKKVTIANDAEHGNYIENAKNLTYFFPYEVNTGKLAVSYDFSTIGQNANDAFNISLYSASGQSMFYGTSTVQADTTKGKIKFSWNGNEKEYDNTQWHHVDLLIDYTSDIQTASLYLDGELITKNPATSTNLYPYARLNFTTTQGNVPQLDNLHIRELSVNSVEGIPEKVSAATKSFDIRFRDPVRTELLTDDNISIIENKTGNEVPVIVSEVTPRSLKIELEEELTVGSQYTLVLPDGVKGYLDEALAQNRFTFTTVPDNFLEVSRTTVMDGATAVSSPADWDAEKTYTLSYDAVNTGTAQADAVFIVAGYQQDQLIAVCMTEAVVPAGGGNDLTAQLDPIDMQGAEEIRVFCLRGFGTLAPLMSSPLILR